MNDTYSERTNMEQEKKTAWIDEKNRIVSFHAVDNSKKIIKAETMFWSYIYTLMSAGYRVM